jgi:para-aminobenzoate synthetase
MGGNGIKTHFRIASIFIIEWAPKKRSIEILQDIEAMQATAISGGRRGIYSGIVGYLSVTDDADWSVIIRSVYHYHDDKLNNENVKCWRIGAGGAITVLSDVDGEWEEMELKLTSALQAFS